MSTESSKWGGGGDRGSYSVQKLANICPFGITSAKVIFFTRNVYSLDLGLEI